MGKFSMGSSGQGQYKAPQQSLGQAVKNGIFYGICLVVIVAAMLIINHVKRRKKMPVCNEEKSLHTGICF